MIASKIQAARKRLPGTPPYEVVHSLTVSISTLSRLLPVASRTIGKWSYRSARRCLGGLSEGMREMVESRLVEKFAPLLFAGEGKRLGTASALKVELETTDPRYA
jgi:hypothetical protein